MFEFVLGGIAGLIVGWNVLPQPAWVQNLYIRWFGPDD
ncbi:hypothetical protein [Sulfitobacter phage vB_SupP_AX]|nr:hypothetical protein [Sulfitobacter phage vB_SupP_AX]